MLVAFPGYLYCACGQVHAAGVERGKLRNPYARVVKRIYYCVVPVSLESVFHRYVVEQAVHFGFLYEIGQCLLLLRAAQFAGGVIPGLALGEHVFI